MTAHTDIAQMAADAMTELMTAHQDTADALVEVEKRRFHLTQGETHFTLEGLEGSNEAARKAFLNDQTSGDRERVLNAEQDLIRARGRLEQAKVKFRGVELTVEIAKLAAEALGEPTE